jgi:hypothetical protein
VNRPCALVLLTVVSAVAFGALTAGGAGAAVKPTVEIAPATGALGDTVKVQLDHWPSGTVIAMVCGNAAKRGTQDCALQGAQGEGVTTSGHTVLGLVLTAPPTPCPCVVAVSTSTNSVVVTTPMTLTGVPDAPVVDAGPTTTVSGGDQLSVTARIEDRDTWGAGTWAQATAGALGGPGHRSLVLTLHNRGTSTLKGLRVDAAVGRTRSSGERVGTQAVGALPAGSRRNISIPVGISAPTWGRYRVFGRIYGGNEAVPFSAKTSADPWLLELSVPILLLLWAQLLRRQARAHRRAMDAPAAIDGTDGHDPEPDLEPLPESSPDVGVMDGSGFGLHPYASHQDGAPEPTAVNGHSRGGSPRAAPGHSAERSDRST